MSDFHGYRPPTSSTTWMLNQLFEVVMPNSTESCWRLVAYMARKTFGWCDRYGNPTEGDFEFSIPELARTLSISPRSVSNAIAEAIEKSFIICIQEGQKKTRGSSGCHAVYRLNFDPTGTYARTLSEFHGFYTGEGRRTAVPDEYFDTTIFTESFPVVKVIGAIFRYTIGFQAERGYRRQVVRMSLTKLQEVTGIGGRRHLVAAIKSAAAAGHIRVLAGSSVADSPTPEAASYQIVWSDAWDGKKGTSAEDPSMQKGNQGSTQERNQRSMQKGNQVPCKEGTSISAEREPLDLRKKGTHEMTDPGNHTLKGQQQIQDVVALLTSLGVQRAKAEWLVKTYPEPEIRKQCSWLPRRQAKTNPAGLLVDSIVEGYSEPAGSPPPPQAKQVDPRKQHELRYLSKYQQYLEGLRAQVETENPDLYARFMASDHKPGLYDASESFRQAWDSMVCSRFIEFLRKEISIPVPDFWHWDEECNPEGYKP